MRLSFASLVCVPATVPGATSLIVAAALGVSSATNAQTTPVRHGLTASVGAAQGSADIHCFDCNMPAASAASGFVRLGYAILPNAVLDVKAHRWSKSTDAVDDDYVFFLLAAQLYPRPAWKHFYVEPGLGYANVSFKSPGSPDTLRLRTMVVSGGVGYDLGITRGLFVTPFLNAIATSSERPTFNGTTINTNHPVMRVTVMELGVAVGWQRTARRRYIPAGERETRPLRVRP